MQDETKVEKTGTTPEETPVNPEVLEPQDPLKAELEKVQRKEPRSEAEKAAFSLKKNAERVKELGLDPKSILGLDEEVDEERPLTVAEFKRMEAEKAQKSALQLAEDIPGEAERELIKYHLNNTIKPTGNPQEDLKLARAIVNSVKNSQIVEEVTRKSEPNRVATNSGSPAKVEGAFTPTPEESAFMRPPFNLTKEDILKAREKEQQK